MVKWAEEMTNLYKKFKTELHVLNLWVNSSPVMLGCLGNKNLNLSSEHYIIVIKQPDIFSFSGARVRTTAAPQC